MFQRYQSRKVFRAFKIAAIVRNVIVLGSGGEPFTLLYPEGNHYCAAPVSGTWEVRYKPVVGGYYVVYEPDGYASFSPADVFEAGYTVIPEGELKR